MTQQLSTNTFGVAKWVVSPTAYYGTHTTIQSAINSASSGDTIFVRTGTYTENPTLIAGINIVGETGDSFVSNVTIIGQVSCSYAGTSCISNIKLQTNSASFISITGSSATTLFIKDCNLNCSNNTGIINTNTSSALNIINCTGNIATTGISLFSLSGGITMINDTAITNTGNSVTASTLSSAATLNVQYCSFNMPITTSNTASLQFQYTNIDTFNLNTTPLVVNGTGSSDLIYCRLASGSATTLTIGTGVSLVAEVLNIYSTSATAVSGLGTFIYTSLNFGLTKGAVNTSNVTGQGTFGTNNGTTPSAGFIGENIVSTVLTGSAISLTTGTFVNVTTISVTPGTWMFTGNAVIKGITTGTSIFVAVSSTSLSGGTYPINSAGIDLPSTMGTDYTIHAPVQIIAVSTTTTYYLTAAANFTGGTVAAYGKLQATRIA